MAYLESFAPVVKLTTTTVFLWIIASKNLKLDQMDVMTAFLNDDLKNDVNMGKPRGF